MRVIRVFLFSAFAALVLSAPAAAQKLEPLAPTATLAETQAWLVKAIGKNSTYNVDLTKKSLSDLKFDGCAFSYVMRSDSRADTMGDATPSDSDSNAREESGGMSSATIIKFSFADMNGENVQVQDVPNNKKMKAIAMESLGGKNAVFMAPKTNKSKGVEKPAIGIFVKADAADAIKAGLTQGIKLCQVPAN